MPDTSADIFYDPDAIYHDDGPFDPSFINEAVQCLMRTLPIDPAEPRPWYARRVKSVLLSVSGLHPRDTTEIMLSVQAVAAHYAALACWRIGMNLRLPHGDSTRHITTAASAARTFDSLLRALERRQAKPLSVPVGRPPSRVWPPNDALDLAGLWEDRILGSLDGLPRKRNRRQEGLPVAWTPGALAIARQVAERERFEEENGGLDLANTEGILPGGGMIVPEEPTPQQVAYMARRMGLMYRREYEDNLRKGIKAYPKIRPIRPGDLVP